MMWLCRCLLLLGLLSNLVLTEQKRPQRGPRPNETERFRYEIQSQPGVYSYCFFCSEKALDDSTYNDKQVNSCLQNYQKPLNLSQIPTNYQKPLNWSQILTPYEWNNKKFAFCREGETPSCGPPPEMVNINWECEEGYSGKLHSIYFSCEGRCNVTGEVAVYAYCNTTFQWDIEEEAAYRTTCFVPDEENIGERKSGGIWQDDGYRTAIIAAIVCSVIVAGVVAGVIYCFCQEKLCFQKKKKKRQHDHENGIELTNVNRNHGQREDFPNDGRNPRHYQNGTAVPVNGYHGPRRGEEAETVLESETNGIIRNKLHTSAASVHRGRKNNNNLLQTIPEKITPRVVSQTNMTDASETVPKQFIDHENTATPHSSLNTGSFDSQNSLNGYLNSSSNKNSVTSSRQCASNSLLQNSVVSKSNNRTEGGNSLNSPIPSGSQNTSHHSCDKSLHSQSSMKPFTTGSNKEDIDQSKDDVNDGEEEEPDETTKLLPASEETVSQTEEEVGLLQSASVHEKEINDERGEQIETDLKGEQKETDFKGEQIETDFKGEQIESEKKVEAAHGGQPHSLGSSSGTGSIREPVEHELPIEPENDDVKEDIKPIVQIISEGGFQGDDKKFYVYKDEPFNIAAKMRPYENGKLTVMREGPGNPFSGRPYHGLPNLPNLSILHVQRAEMNDGGTFTWSLMSDVETSYGMIEIVVLEKDKDIRPENPPGALTRETVNENRGLEVSTGVQNQPPSSGILSGAPRLDPGSLDDTPRLGHGSHVENQSQNAENYGRVHFENKSQTAENYGTANMASQDQTPEEVKGERCSGDFGDIPFYDLDPATMSDRFHTREGPSGTSVEMDDKRNPCTGDTSVEHETRRKTVVEVSGGHNCCMNVKHISKSVQKCLKRLNVKEFENLARQHGISMTVLQTLEFFEEPGEEESESVLSLLDLLGDWGLRLGHILDYFSNQNVPHLETVVEDICREHHDCPYCVRYDKS